MENKSNLSGYLYAFSAYLIWGILPIYWKTLSQIPPAEILANRIIWSFVSLFLLNAFFLKKKIGGIIFDKKNRLAVFLTGALISVNWGIFIYAIGIGKTVEASFGYYINPLVSILFGILFLKEKLSVPGIIALAFAASGVAYQLIKFGKMPWIAIILAVSFAFYGLIKKKVKLDSLASLMVETMLMAPVAFAFYIYLFTQGQQHIFVMGIKTDLLIIFSGIVTSLPLFLFAEGAKRIPLSTIGFMQYFAPTMMLLIGVFIFKEEFKTDNLISFAFIWTGLIIYTGASVMKMKKIKSKDKIGDMELEN